jgi:ankyrin repeat protein
MTTPLYKAVYYNNVDLVVSLIKQGADVNEKNKACDQKDENAELHERSATPLFAAIWNSDFKMVHILLNNGARVNVNAPFYGYGTPLHCAIGKRNPEIVRILLKYGAEPNSISPSDGTPLHSAISGDNPEIVRMLLKHGAKINSVSPIEGTPIHCAVGTGNLEIVRMLIERGADVNAMMEISSSELLGDKVSDSIKTSITPLHKLMIGECPYFKQLSRISIIKMLIDKGADVNRRDPVFGITPLHCAVRYRDQYPVQVLIERGANVNAHGTGKYSDITPLHYALESHDLEMAKYLLAHGAKDDENRVITEEDKSIAQSQRRSVINASLTLGIPLAYLGASIYCYEFRFKHNRSSNGMGTLNAFALSTFGFATAGYMLGSVLLSGGTRDNGLQMLAGGMFGVLIGVPAGLVFMHYQHLPRNAKRNRGLYYAAPAASMMIPIVVFSRHF